MKHVVSVSLGSSSRDSCVEKNLLGLKYVIERRGTDGDVKRAKALYEELDGQVDALGLGGATLYITAGKKKFYFKQVLKMVENVKETPLADGNYLKDILERRVINYVDKDLGLDLKTKKVLVVCAVDRFGMAEAFCSTGAATIFGDVIFALGLPVPIKTMAGLRRAAAVVAPLITKLPISLVYPSGKAQDRESKRVHNRYYQEADIIAGDYHYIKKNFPQKLAGKVIVTNTITRKDVERLRALDVKMLVTTTPEIEGRSFGTNVMEGIIAAYLGKSPAEIRPEEFNAVLDELNFVPRVVYFNK